MRLAILTLILAAVGAPGLAQTVAPSPSSDAALAAKLAHDAEIADQDRRSDALNVEINRKNRDVQARNDAAKAAFEKAMADYRSQVAAQEAANAKVQADYQKRVEAWKADVAACKAGDATRCAQPPGRPGAP
ncbi:MAG: hypothetical protein JSS35_00150 [Proteobacteria bacterium]|nr:hypothetical protein [Pseudomonadota bacterium]